MRKFYVFFLIAALLYPIFTVQAQQANLTIALPIPEVDLIWSGDTYVPPFYKGGSLFSSQSIVNFIAIPRNLGPVSEMNFRWIKNGTVVGGASGALRNTFASLDTIVSKPQTIKIEIFTENNGTASSSITITPQKPVMIVYENNPLYGFMFHQDIGTSYDLKESEITLAAFPLFFASPHRFDSEITYQWTTNSGVSETRNQVVYRAPDNEVGSSQVSVRANNLTEILQEARRGFLLKFNSSTGL